MSHNLVHVLPFSWTATSPLFFPYTSISLFPVTCKSPASHCTERMKAVRRDFPWNLLQSLPPALLLQKRAAPAPSHLLPGSHVLSPAPHSFCNCHSPVPHHRFPSLLDHSHEHTHMLLFFHLEISSLDPNSPTNCSLISLPCAPPLPAPKTSPSSTSQATIISCVHNCNSLLIDLPSTPALLLSDLYTATKRICLNVNSAWDKTLLHVAHKYPHSLIHLCSLPSALATWTFYSSPKQPSHTSSMEPIALVVPSAYNVAPAPSHPDSHMTQSFSSSVFAQMSP